ncbi:hypothetical protein [Nonomuraea sp. NPDC049709]|uniref:hypothetical protein n=1 Tax=Nonomuraea sp. NPDC049709 TaxID=3154736 RepID=UPI003421C028
MALASRNAAVCTSEVPRCAAPLIWVPTQKATRSGLVACSRGRTMSTARSIALARTLFGLMIAAPVLLRAGVPV